MKRAIGFGNFNKGLHDGDPLEIDTKELFVAENVIVDSSGSVLVCSGKANFLDTYSTAPTGLYEFRIGAAETYFVKVSNNSTLEYAGATAWTSVGNLTNFTAGEHYNTFATVFGATANASLLVIGGYNSAPYRWNPNLTPALTLLAGNPPAGRLLCEHGNRLILSGVSSYPNRIYWSGMGNCESWGANDWVDVGERDAEDSIVMLLSLSRKLFIIKERSVWVMLGTSPSVWQIDKILDKGTCAPCSVVGRGEYFYFVDEDGIFISDGISYKLLGLRDEDGTFPLERFWKTVNKSSLSKTEVKIVNDQLRIAVPTGSSTNNNFLINFHLNLLAYTLNNMYASRKLGVRSIVGEDNLISGEATRCYIVDSGTKATSINSIAETKSLYQHPHGSNIFIPRIELMLNTLNNTKGINVLVKGDRGKITSLTQVNITSSELSWGVSGGETSSTLRWADYPTDPTKTKFTLVGTSSEYQEVSIDCGIVASEVSVRLESLGNFGLRGGRIYYEELREGINK